MTVEHSHTISMVRTETFKSQPGSKVKMVSHLIEVQEL